MTTLTFDFLSIDGCERRDLTIREVVIGGWAGRDMRAVQEHIAELQALGVAPPQSIPCFYRASRELLTTAEDVDVLGSDSSGEVEYIIVCAEDGWWIGLGSDHTDRKMEATSVSISKQMCPKPVAPVLWRFEDVATHWDELILRSYVEEDGRRVAYQDGSVRELRDPQDLIRLYSNGGRDFPPGALMFGGTLPVYGGIRPRHVMELELIDPVRNRRISHRYVARWLPVV